MNAQRKAPDTGNPKPHRLENLELDAVAFVSAGAQMRDFFIRKSKEQTVMDAKTLKSILEVEAEGEAAIIEAFRKANESATDEACDAVVKAYRLLSAHAETLPEGTIEGVAKSLDGSAAEAIGTVAEIEKGKLKWIAQQLGLTEEQLKSAIDGAKDDGEEKTKKGLVNEDGSVNEEVAKSYPADVRDEMISLAKERAEQGRKIEALEKAQAAEKDARIMRECIEKAAPYRVLGAVPEKFAPILKAVDERLEKDAAGELYGLLDRLTKLVEKSELLKEIGLATSEPEDDDPMAQLKKVAKDLQKEDSSLTFDQALARAASIRKDLTSAHYSRR